MRKRWDMLHRPGRRRRLSDGEHVPGTIGDYTTPCYTVKTLAGELDAKKLSWHFYAPNIADSGGAWFGVPGD